MKLLLLPLIEIGCTENQARSIIHRLGMKGINDDEAVEILGHCENPEQIEIELMNLERIYEG